MFRILFKFFIFISSFYCFVSIPSYDKQNQKSATNKGVGCTSDYNPPGTVNFPLGDEELNNDILEEPGFNEAKEKVNSLEQFSGKCNNLASSENIQDSHIACDSNNSKTSEEILYSSNAQSNPTVQCKKCDLKVVPDGTGVIVHCFECYDIPPPANTKMWSRKLVKFYKPQVLPKLARNRSQTAATAKVISDDHPSDINNLKIGETVYGFKVQNVQDIPVFNIKAVQLQHERTKAEYLHLFRNDGNNVFSINFRTTPKDSTGLPHILEHNVLCGSKLYPVRDPFFKMLNRSLATFMNAMTGSDYTIYPFSTQNYTDYCNLQKIYLDAVFRPTLKELDFMQEGWRLENANPTDISSELVIKGVVYNEMKGAFSENESVLMQRLQNVILPDHTYGVISGGDPLKIPNLTWEDLKKFHKEHYHPSNSRFYSYGNFPLLPTLKYLNSEYLSQYEYHSPNNTTVPQQNRWNQPRKEHVVGRFENMREPFEKQNTICIAIMMSDITDVYETFLMQFITELLVKGPNSPFYKSMIEPNFSGGFTQCTGFDTQTRDSVFTVGLQGLPKNDFDKVIDIFDKTIDDVITNGFDLKQIESVLHRYELSIKHETSNFGLVLLFGLTPILNHNGDIINALEVNKLIEKLRLNMGSDEKYLQKVVEQYFKNNKHRVVLSMSPDKEYETKQSLLEKKLIFEKTKALTATDKQTIFAKALQLVKEQSTEQNTNLLPTLQMQDINPDIERTPSMKTKFGSVPTQMNLTNTNGITYFKSIINTSELSVEQQMLLPLFCYIITKMGTKNLDYREFDSLVNLKTAGLNVDVHIAESLFQLHSYEPGIILSSHCLDDNVESMWNIWKQIFEISELRDVKRFQTLVQLYMANLTHGLADAGHAYAMQAASAMVSGVGYQKELLTGLQHIAYMKRLIRTSNYDAMLAELCNITRILFDKNKLRCALNISEASRPKVSLAYEKFVKELPGNTFGKPNENAYCTTNVWTPKDAVNCQHHVLNVPVNYCSKAILTVPYTDPEFAKLRVLARLLSAKYLHPELREKQGAYGGGARITPDGVFTFFSYRDPHSFKTLDVFDNTQQWTQKELKNMTPQDVLEAKLGVFQSVDAPIPPSSKGCNEFIRGLTPDVLQRHRAEIMTVDHTGLQSVSEKYLYNKDSTLVAKVILGSKGNNADTSNRLGELWTVIDNE